LVDFPALFFSCLDDAMTRVEYILTLRAQLALSAKTVITVAHYFSLQEEFTRAKFGDQTGYSS